MALQVAAAAKLVEDCLTGWARKATPTDRAFYDRSGEWRTDPPSMLVGRSQGGPASAAAAAWRYGGQLNGGQLAVARDSIDWALANGSRFGLGSAVIETMMFAHELGTTRLLIPASVLGDARAKRWDDALTQAGDLCALNARWLANGNINLGYCLAIYLAARVTGLQRLRDAFQQAWAFTMRHLVVTQTPSWTTQTVGAAYFTEDGGYDPAYQQVQLDTLSRLTVLSGDPFVAGVMNLCFNQIRKDVGADFSLDVSYGSRHKNTVWQRVPFTTPAAELLVTRGRAGLRAFADGQWPEVDAAFRATMTYSNVAMMKNLGGQVGTLLVDALIARGELERVRL
jgi:hypothetical protein